MECRQRRKADFALTTAKWALKPICAVCSPWGRRCGACKGPACSGRWTDSRPRDLGKKVIMLCIMEVAGNRAAPLLHLSPAPTAVINCAMKAEGTEVGINRVHMSLLSLPHSPTPLLSHPEEGNYSKWLSLGKLWVFDQSWFAFSNIISKNHIRQIQ